MRTHRPAPAAFLLAAVLAATAATKVSAEPGAAFRLACPATVDLSYTQVGRLDFGAPDPKLDLTGWQPRFAPATVRLIGAEVNPGPDEKGEISGNMADNGDTAKPGEPLVYTVWHEGQQKPAFAAYVLCEYEGGFAMQRALPPTTRVCSLRITRRKAAPSETTTREFIAVAEFSCQ